MGMDLFGSKPAGEVGNYFGNTVWWWLPLPTYARELAPHITGECTRWQCNDGDGLSEDDSRELANILQSEIDSGRAGIYARRDHSQYQFSSENVQRFANFLRDCGGFEIW